MACCLLDFNFQCTPFNNIFVAVTADTSRSHASHNETWASGDQLTGSHSFTQLRSWTQHWTSGRLVDQVLCHIFAHIFAHIFCSYFCSYFLLILLLIFLLILLLILFAHIFAHIFAQIFAQIFAHIFAHNFFPYLCSYFLLIYCYLPVPRWTWCGWKAAEVSHWYSWCTAAQRSSPARHQKQHMELMTWLNDLTCKQTPTLIFWTAIERTVKRNMFCPTYLKDLKTSNVQNTNKWGSLPLGSVQGLVDSHHDPFEHSFVKRLGNCFNGKFSLSKEQIITNVERKGAKGFRYS